MTSVTASVTASVSASASASASANNDTNNIINNPANSNLECVELRNIKYKSMLLKKSSPKQLTKYNSNNDIDTFLEKERSQNKEDQWVKLDKTMKIKKITAFVETYSIDNNLNDKDKASLQDFLSHCLDQKKILKTKDVVYDKVNGVITNIPCLLYTPTLTKKFTLKRCEKRQSTLKSLAPKNKIKKNTPSTTMTIDSNCIMSAL
jgi:hypothetical protein